MTVGVDPRRRALAQALAGVLVGSVWRVSSGQAQDGGEVKEPAGGGDIVLSVLVTGGGKPVVEAEVKVTFPPPAGGELTLLTDQAGHAVFASPGTGTAVVRVLAKGWMTERREVELVQGPQELGIELSAFQNQQ